MLEHHLPVLRSPATGGPIRLDPATPPVRARFGELLGGRLVDEAGSDAGEIADGVWDALGGRRPERTLAQLSNVLPPTPQLYERTWRRRSLTLLSGRPFPLEEELDELDAALGDVAGVTVVDIGCSEGLYARHLAARGAAAIGLDHSRAFLVRARRRAADLGTPISPVRALAQHLPMADAVAGAVVIGGSLNEIGDAAAAVAEAARVLRPGGAFFMMSLVAAASRRGSTLQRALGPLGIAFPRTDAVLSMLERHGFEISDVRVDRVVLRVVAVRPAGVDEA